MFQLLKNFFILCESLLFYDVNIKLLFFFLVFYKYLFYVNYYLLHLSKVNVYFHFFLIFYLNRSLFL